MFEIHELPMGIWSGVLTIYAWITFWYGVQCFDSGRAERGSIFSLAALSLVVFGILGPLWRYQPPGEIGYDNWMLIMGWMGAAAFMSMAALTGMWIGKRRERRAALRNRADSVVEASEPVTVTATVTATAHPAANTARRAVESLS